MSPSLSARLLGTQSDQRLAELVGKGHERAFEAIVHRYRRPLLSYCRRMGLSDSRAEDVVQQSLLKAWLALQSGTSVRELRPWLYRIAHNTAVNAIRSFRDDSAVLDATSPDQLSGESELERRIAARAALSDVAALPPMQRDAILMSAIDGRSHDEVALAMGISSGAVRGLLYRARAALRSAAAALTPQPLISWASGGAGRLAPTAGRIAELSGSGGSDAGATLLKGVAVAVTAAVAAGAVLVPRHHARSHGAQRPTAPASAAAASTPLLASSGGSRSASAPSLATVAPRSTGTGVARTVVTAPLQPTRERASSPAGGGRGGHGGGSTVTAPTTTGPGQVQSSTGAAPVGSSADAGHPVEGTSAAPPSGQPPSSAPPPPGGGSEGTKSPGGGSGGSEAEHEKEEEGGESTGHGGDEAEEAEEKAEREAEEARERKEREAEQAREREAGKDH